MHVQRVAIPTLRVESWTVLGHDGTPIEPIERYLAYLTDIERSPNTVKAYAHDVKDYWVFLAFHSLDWREVRLEDIGEYVAWLRPPPAGREGAVAIVARTAVVSRSWLYNEPDIRAEIQRLRDATRRAPFPPIPAAQRATAEAEPT